MLDYLDQERVTLCKGFKSLEIISYCGGCAPFTGSFMQLSSVLGMVKTTHIWDPDKCKFLL